MKNAIALNIIKYFNYKENALFLLVDKAYDELAQAIKKCHEETEIICFESYKPEDVKEIFNFSSSTVVLLFAEPTSYVEYRLFEYLDFSNGEPVIPNTVSKVLIFPKESLCRIFSEGADNIAIEREKLISEMKDNQNYRITSSSGTDLTFESRRWIPLDFEICTAPIEESINGIIVVDGALFYKKTDDKMAFVIRCGKIQLIKAISPKGDLLVAEYKKMTERNMQNSINMQLAEIGIGFCNNAIISDCFMEAEAVSKTCHFCFGNNICYGGRNESEFHGASVLIKNPIFTPINPRENC